MKHVLFALFLLLSTVSHAFAYWGEAWRYQPYRDYNGEHYNILPPAIDNRYTKHEWYFWVPATYRSSFYNVAPNKVESWWPPETIEYAEWSPNIRKLAKYFDTLRPIEDTMEAALLCQQYAQPSWYCATKFPYSAAAEAWQVRRLCESLFGDGILEINLEKVVVRFPPPNVTVGQFLNTNKHWDPKYPRYPIYKHFAIKAAEEKRQE